MRTPYLAGLELRRFRRAPLTRAAIMALALIPLLYAGLYLWAFWDPYGNVDKIPVALVNQDRPATVSGSTLRAGQSLEDELIDRHVFDWHVTSAAEASRGLNDGTYLMTFTIPANFSSSLASPDSATGTPVRGRLTLVGNDANNYVAGVIGRSAFAEIRTAAADSAAEQYFDRMFLSFATLHTKTAQAASGAGKLADGAASAKGGADKLKSGADDAASGADQLASGLATAHKGAQDLTTGLVALNSGAAQLDDGAGKAANGTAKLASTVDSFADRAEPFLRQNSGSIKDAATQLADGADAVAAHIDELPKYVDTVVDRTADVKQALADYAAAHPEASGDPNFQAAQKAANDAYTAAKTAQGKLRDDSAALADIKANARKVAVVARTVAAAAPHLADDVANARKQIDALNSGVQDLAKGAASLHKGTTAAVGAGKSLTAGLYQLATGARQLDGGLGSLSSGAGKLATGLDSLSSGAARLADGLSSGAAQIPAYDAKQRADRAGVMADPVDLSRYVRNAAATYGEGFAPYFLALSLWVGAMVGYMLLRPVNRRHLSSGAPAWRVAAAGWLPAIAIGVAQAAIVSAVLRLTLGLDPVRPWAMVAFLATAVLAYTGLQQLFGAALGSAGRVLTLVVLVAQLVTAGGTYPLQTSPHLLAVIHPYLPMSYVVSCLRHLISGGSTGMVWAGAGILTAFGAGAYALTCLVVRRASRLTPTTLHPDLEL